MMTASSSRCLLPPRLDLWIVATMAKVTGVRDRFAKAAITAESIRRALAEVETFGIRDGHAVSSARIVDCFGPPAIAEANKLAYNLPLWPAHQFVWAVSRLGDAAGLGLQLRAIVPVTRALPFGLEMARATFKSWYHTEHEVQSALGRPDRVEDGAGRVAKWVFAPSGAQEAIRLSFAWGLLYEIAGQPLDLFGAANSDWPGPATPFAEGTVLRGDRGGDATGRRPNGLRTGDARGTPETAWGPFPAPVLRHG